MLIPPFYISPNQGQLPLIIFLNFYISFARYVSIEQIRVALFGPRLWFFRIDPHLLYQRFIIPTSRIFFKVGRKNRQNAGYMHNIRKIRKADKRFLAKIALAVLGGICYDTAKLKALASGSEVFWAVDVGVPSIWVFKGGSQNRPKVSLSRILEIL